MGAFSYDPKAQDGRWAAFDYGQYGQTGPNGEDWYTGFGLKDIEAAQAMGYNNPQIRILGQQAIKQGRPVGQKVQDWLNTNTAAGPWEYATYGGVEFGQADLNEALNRGANYNDIQRYTDYANQHNIGVGDKAQTWLNENKDNYDFMGPSARSEVDRAAQLDSQIAAEARAAEEWERQAQRQKELNPRIYSQNAMMKTSGAGGVAIKRSDAFRRAGGTRSTKQAHRSMLIDSLNI